MSEVYYGSKSLSRGLNLKYISLNDPDLLLTARFTAIHDKEINGARFRISSVLDPPVYRLGLQEDLDGVPSGTFLGSGTFTPTVGIPGCLFDRTVKQKQGSRYHLVIQYENGTIDATHYAQTYVIKRTVDTTPWYLFYGIGLEDAFEDENHICGQSTDGGSTWSSTRDAGNVLACFKWGVRYGTAEYYGNLYTDTGVEIEIRGNNWQCEVLRIPATKVVSAVDLEVYKTGNPPNDLEVVLRNVTDAVDMDTVSIAPGSVPAAAEEWTRATFSSDQILSSEKSYRLIVKTTGGDAANYYNWVRLATIATLEEATWLTDDSFLQTSGNAGAAWASWIHMDAVFRFVEVFQHPLYAAAKSF